MSTYDDEAAAQTAPANPYDAVVQSIYGDAETTLRAATVAAAPTPPADAAEATQIGSKLGLPSSIVLKNLPAFRERVKSSETPYEQIVRQTPALAAWSSDPVHQAAAKGDLEQLGFLEWLKTAPKRAWERGQLSTELGMLRAKEAFGQTLTADEQQRVATLRQQLAPAGPLSGEGQWFRGAIAGTTEQLPLLWGSTLMGAKYAAAGAVETGAALGMVGGLGTGGAGAIPTAVAGGLAGASAGFFFGQARYGVEVATGQAYDEFSKITDDLGRPLDPRVARAAAVAVGAVNGALMTGGARVLLERFPGVDRLVGKGGQETVAVALRNPAVQSALLGAVGDYGKAWSLVTANMVAQRAVTILGGQVAKVAGGATPEAATQEGRHAIIEDLERTAVDSAQSFALMTLPGAVGRYVRLRVDASHAAANTAFFKALGDGVSQSATIKRAPDAAQAFLQSVAQDGPIPTVYAPIKFWQSYWESKGVDPAKMAADVTGDPQAYRQASATGTDLPIPTAAYAVKLAGTEHNAAFAPELRLDPAQMNAREAVAFEAELKRQIPTPAVPTAETDAIQQHVVDQLVGAQVPRDVAEQYAPVYAAAFRTLGERAGVDPSELYARYGLTVTREGVPYAAPERAQPEGHLAEHPGAVAVPHEGGEGSQRAPERARDQRGDRYAPSPAEQALGDFHRTLEAQLTPEARVRALETAAGPPGSRRVPFPIVDTEHASDLLRAADLSTARDVTVPIDQIVATQPSVNVDVAVGKLRGAAEAPALALEYQGRYYLADGTHRAVSEWARGAGSVTLHVAAVDEERLARIVAQRQQAAEHPTGLVKPAPVDTAAAAAQTGAVHETGAEGAGAATGEGGRQPGARVEASPAPARETKRQFASRRTEHYAAVFDAVLANARAVDPAVDPAALRAEFTDRVDLLDELDRDYRESGHDPRQLLRAISKYGGISLEGEAGGGLTGELRWIRESPALGPFGNFGGVAGVFRTRERGGLVGTGHSVDEMLTMLQGDPAFAHLQSIDDLVTALEDVARMGEAGKGGTLPGTRELAKLAGMAPDRAWWLPGGGAETRFDQGPKPGETPADLLDTGEQQARLPGDVGAVRETEKPTPQFEAPFALTSPETKPGKGKQSSLFQGERGSISFGGDRRFNIELLRNADLSTFLHETGHFYLEVLGDLADPLRVRTDLTEGQTGLVHDYDRILEFVGAETRAAITTEQHETFARAFEAYLMEGKAPSAELRPVFARFRAWLTSVYRSIRSLNVELTPEVRGMFDRLLASDEAIQAAEQEGDVRPLFTTAEQAGMTPADFAAYRTVVANASEKAREALQTRVLRDVQRERQTWWTNEHAAVRDQVAAEFNDQPTYRALAAIRDGTHPDGTPLDTGEPIKISKASLAGYDAETLKGLRRLDAYRVDGGLDVNDVAALVGFSSGDELVQALKQAPTLRQALNVEADRRMRERHGELLLDGTLEQRADALVNGDYRQTVVRAELKALTKAMQRGTIPPAAVIRAHAEQRISETKVRDLKPGLFLMAARRASQRAFDLLASGEDRTGAVKAKHDELVNLALYKAALAAQDFATDARDYLGPYFDKPATRQRIGKAGGEYLDQIDALRGRYELTQVSNKVLDRRSSLADFLQGQQQEGHELAVVPALLNELRRPTNYREVSIGELQGVYDAVKSIEHWAQFKNRLLRQAAQRELEALGIEGAQSVADHAGQRGVPPLEPRRPGPIEAKRALLSFEIAHRPLQAILRELDGYQDGFFFREFWRPLHEARTAETLAGHDANLRWTAIHDARFAGRERELYAETYIPALGESLSTAARLAVAFNYGNEGNRERLRAAGIGNTGPLDDTKIRGILDTLTAEDWQYVRDTVALVNSYKPAIGALYKRVTGVEPTWVDPTPFQTAHGEMPGWYYPIAYERRAAVGREVGPVPDYTDVLAKASYMRYQTRNGHTEARTAHTGAPLRADLGVVGEHLQQVIHDLSFREPLIDAARLLRRSDLQVAIKQHYGDQYLDEIRGAFRDVAVGALPAPGWYRTFLNVRAGATMARLAWNVATAVRHVLNITAGMVRVGAPEVTAATMRWMGSARDQENSAGWVRDTSPFMASRWDHRYEEIRSIKSDIGLNRGPMAAAVRDAVTNAGLDPDLGHHVADSYLYMIHKVIQMAEIPTWLAQYRKSLEAFPEDHGRARASADSAVADAFGGGDLIDQAALQRSYAGKLFTTFMTYGLSLHRLNYEIFAKDQTVGRKIVDATLLNLVPAMFLSGVFSYAYQKEDYWRELIHELAGQALGMAILAREVAGAFERQDYEGPASFGAVSTLYRLVNRSVASFEAKTPEGRAGARKAVGRLGVELVGQYFGVPVFQIEKTASGIEALSSGKAKDLTALLFGARKKKAS